MYFNVIEMTPQCTNVIDLWGQNDGSVVIVWQPLQTSVLQNMKNLRNQEHLVGKRKSFGKEPLFYSLNFGITKTQVKLKFLINFFIFQINLKLFLGKWPFNIQKNY